MKCVSENREKRERDSSEKFVWKSKRLKSFNWGYIWMHTISWLQNGSGTCGRLLTVTKDGGAVIINVACKLVFS